MMGPVEEIELAGGGINRVVRIGDAVHRPSAPWSRATCELLNVLHAAGLPVPAWRGADEQGREVLDYLPGEVGHYPLSEAVRSEAALVSAARLLRRFHDVSVPLVTRDLGWQLTALPGAEVVRPVVRDLPLRTARERARRVGDSSRAGGKGAAVLRGVRARRVRCR